MDAWRWALSKTVVAAFPSARSTSLNAGVLLQRGAGVAADEDDSMVENFVFQWCVRVASLRGGVSRRVASTAAARAQSCHAIVLGCVACEGACQSRGGGGAAHRHCREPVP
jgi:hypothetical protein